MRRAALTLLTLTALLPGPAPAQVTAPSLVDEDLAPEEAKPVTSEPRPPEPLPAPAPATPAPPVPSRAVEPVRSTWAAVLDAWYERRRALREADAGAAQRAAARLLDARRDLAIENLYPFAASEVREAERAIAARLPGDAVDHAELAVQLAPDLADAHLALARSLLARDPLALGPALPPMGAALDAALHEPHTTRAFLGDLLAAGLAAVALAGTITLLVLLGRRARLLFHDFGHLPLVRSATTVQGTFLLVVLLALPLALGLGPWAALAGLVLSAWLYLDTHERLVATAALLALAALPWGAEAAARATAWTGTLAEEVFELEHGADDGARAARLAAQPGLPPLAMLALGRTHKRRGALDEAMTWYGRAEQAGGRTPELQVAVGNVKFLRGDLEGAKAAWLDAADRAGAPPTTLAAAHYNLSKLYLRQSALEQAHQARRRAQLVAPEFLARYGSDDDFRANRWILDAPASHQQIDELAAGDGAPRLAGDAVRARLAGAIPPLAWPSVTLGSVALLWLVALLARRLRPSTACQRCGRPACARCDQTGGPLCGQCVNVFVRKGLVDPRDRRRKEDQVRRHERVDRWVGCALAVLGGGAGQVWRGRATVGALALLGTCLAGFVLLLWRGLIPPPHPSPYVLVGKIAGAAPLGLLLYGLSVRDVFRRGSA